MNYCSDFAPFKMILWVLKSFIFSSLSEKKEPELMPWQKGVNLRKTVKSVEDETSIEQDREERVSGQSQQQQTTMAQREERQQQKRPPPGPLESTVHGKEVHTAVQKQTQKEVSVLQLPLHAR